MDISHAQNSWASARPAPDFAFGQVRFYKVEMRLNKLDLNLLVVLDILLVERSVSATAARLRLTQPAISNALSRLRVHFEDELLVQVGRRMAPTPFAEALADPVHRAIAALENISSTRAEFDPTSAEREFSIMCSDFVFQTFLADALARLAKEAPGLSVTCLLTGEPAAEGFREGGIDFAITPQARIIPDQPSAALFSERFSCIAWRENPLVGSVVSRERYLELEHVCTCLGPNNPPHVEERALSAQGINRRIAVYAPNFASVPFAVVGTNRIATVHARTAELYSKLLPLKVFAPPVEIPAFVEFLQWKRSSAADPGAGWMRDFLIRSAAAF